MTGIICSMDSDAAAKNDDGEIRENLKHLQEDPAPLFEGVAGDLEDGTPPHPPVLRR